MISRSELAKELQITQQHVDYILKKKGRPSSTLALRLERLTGIDRRAWLWPDEFPNPMMGADEDSKISHL